MILLIIKNVISLVNYSTFWVLLKLKFLVTRLLLVLFLSGIILWLSIFFYGTFYYAYMPSISEVRPVYFQFRVCESGFGICSFPTANVSIVKEGQDGVFARGQSYRIILELDMPESQINKDLGMFMVKISLHSRSGKTIAESARSVVLRYKSELLQMMDTLLFSPYLLFGFTEQKQTLTVEFFANYFDDAYSPAVGVIIEVQNMRIQFYTAVLKMHAHFTGLRYLLFYWPTVSAIFGVSLNVMFLSFIALLSWYQFLMSTRTAAPEVVRIEFKPKPPLEQRRQNMRNILERERQELNVARRQQLGEAAPPVPEETNNEAETLEPTIEKGIECVEHIGFDEEETLLLNTPLSRSSSTTELRLRHATLPLQDTLDESYSHLHKS